MYLNHVERISAFVVSRGYRYNKVHWFGIVDGRIEDISFKVASATGIRINKKSGATYVTDIDLVVDNLKQKFPHLKYDKLY